MQQCPSQLQSPPHTAVVGTHRTCERRAKTREGARLGEAARTFLAWDIVHHGVQAQIPESS